MNHTAVACAMGMSLLTAAMASAQTGPAPAGRSSLWELAVLVGAGTATSPGGNSGQLPPAGESFAMSGGTTSRLVPSWFFGDGTSILNQKLSSNFLTARILPVDEALTSSSAYVGKGISVAARLSRQLSPRFAVEFGFHVAPRPVRPTESAVSNADQAAAGFENSFRQLFTLVTNAGTVTTDVEVADSTGLQVVTSVDLRIMLAYHHSTRPYITVGGGLIAATGSDASIGITGNYDFVRRTNPFPPFNETDRLMIRYDTGTSFLMSFGGGVTRDLTQRLGIRADAAFTAFPDRLTIHIDTSPSLVVGSPTGVTQLLGTPGLQFSTAAGIPSNLSTSLVSFQTFQGAGWRTGLRVEAGLFFRF